MTKVATAIAFSPYGVFFRVKAQTALPLKLQQTIPLPGVTGSFDHFAIDLSEDVLFAAAKGNHTVEVVDLKTGKIIQSDPRTCRSRMDWRGLRRPIGYISPTES